MVDHVLTAADAARIPSLRQYLSSLRDRPSDLRTVSRTVDPSNFEVTAVLQQLEDRGEFPAVHFRAPLDRSGNQSRFGLVTNLFSTRERCARMLGLSQGEAGAELGLHYGRLIGSPIEPVLVDPGDAPVQENILRGDEADLDIFPAVRHAEMDLGSVLTMAHVMRPPDGNFYNVTFAKTCPTSRRRGGITIHTPHLSRMLREWMNLRRRAPIVNVLGHAPGFWLGSLALTAYGIDEYTTIGGCMGYPLRLVPSVTWGSEFLVPADAEIVIEGELIPGEQAVVNPFGEVTRQYQAQELAPVMEVQAVTYRSGAVMQDVFSGHREHWILGAIPREGSLLKHLRNRFGAVAGVHLPDSGCGRMSAYVSVGSGVPAKQVAVECLAQAPMLQTVVVVDDDIDVFKEEDVLWATHMYVDPRRDVDFLKNYRDPTDQRAMGSNRLLLDATRPTHVAFPTRLRVPPEAIAAVDLDTCLDPLPSGGPL